MAVGTVQSVQLYGAFLEFEDSTSGLLHVSQISHDRVANVADVLSVGDKIKVLAPPIFISSSKEKTPHQCDAGLPMPLCDLRACYLKHSKSCMILSLPVAT